MCALERMPCSMGADGHFHCKLVIKWHCVCYGADGHFRCPFLLGRESALCLHRGWFLSLYSGCKICLNKAVTVHFV